MVIGGAVASVQLAVALTSVFMALAVVGGFGFILIVVLPIERMPTGSDKFTKMVAPAFAAATLIMAGVGIYNMLGMWGQTLMTAADFLQNMVISFFIGFFICIVVGFFLKGKAPKQLQPP